jgi:hypothetical protein
MRISVLNKGEKQNLPAILSDVMPVIGRSLAKKTAGLYRGV